TPALYHHLLYLRSIIVGFPPPFVCTGLLLSLALTVVVAVAVASMTVASTLLLRIELVADLKAI
ncbi:MAG: hypothetical protein WBX78_20215, partial [Pseudolabrys sp.]